jgi:hypothetical protein
LNGFVEDVGVDDAANFTGDVANLFCAVLFINVLDVSLALLFGHGNVEIVKVEAHNLGQIVESRKLNFLSHCNHCGPPKNMKVFYRGPRLELQGF